METRQTISVKGVGRIEVEPDRVVLSFSVESLDRNYAESINGLNARVNRLRSVLEPLGIDRKELKTSSFSVGTERGTERRYDEETEEYLFVGYEARHGLTLRLPMDQNKLNSILNEIAAECIEAEFNIHFESSDKKGAQERLLKKAVSDAEFKASVLAEATGMKLGRILSMDHRWSEISFTSTGYMMESRAEKGMMCSAPDIEPSEIQARDTVELVWEFV